MKTTDHVLSATEFKAERLRILDELDSRGVVITKRGQPVAKVAPLAKWTIRS